MENKQTAVEWLENEFQEIFKEWGGLDTIWIKRFEQAKAMEKEQIILANEDCSTNELGEFISGEQYYNEAYGKVE